MSYDNGDGWVPVPGASGTELLAFVRKPDIVSCNSYILKGPEDLVVIDPGADADQMRAILTVLHDEMATSPRRVTFFLTHCHVDHCYQVASVLSGGWTDVVVAAQEEGAQALARLDGDLTQARIMGWDFPPTFLELHYCSLLGGGLERRGFVGDINLAVAGEDLMVDGRPVRRWSMPLGPDLLEIYHTPGHSPDSVCYRLGRLLFTGDLMFAADPGIAGLVGWCLEDLKGSVANILGLLRELDIQTCYPGHGRPLPVEKAVEVLEGMRSRLGELGSIKTIDLERVRFTSDYALDILEDANEAFTVIAGRLYYLSYYLEELEELGEAEHCLELVRSDRIDELLVSFHSFVEEFREGRKVQLQVVLKAVQTIQAIERLFKGTKLEDLMDASLLRRTSRLLNDFTNAIKGIDLQVERSAEDPRALMGATVDALKAKPLSEDEMLAAVDEDQAFLAALARQIARLPVFEEMEFTFEGIWDPCLCLVDRERFVDAASALIEEFVAVDATVIRLKLANLPDRAEVRVRSDRDLKLLTGNKERAHWRRFNLAGCVLEERPEGEGWVLAIGLFSPK